MVCLNRDKFIKKKGKVEIPREELSYIVLNKNVQSLITTLILKELIN